MVVVYMRILFITLAAIYTFLPVIVTNAVGSEPDNFESLPLTITPRIIGGTAAIPGVWPWMAALIRSDSSNYYYGNFCGGALIAETWVLTAAHCVYDEYLGAWDAPGEVDVVMGLYNLKSDVGDRISVKRIVGHPKYNPITFDSDLALLELERSSAAQTLSLFSGSANVLAESPAVIIGWGDTGQSCSERYPGELQQVSVPLVSNTVCSAAYSGMITKNMLCSGYAEGGKDSCAGDSGGPLMVQVDSQWQHAGIISWGSGCALPNLYGVNTRTSEFSAFISSYLSPLPNIVLSPATVQFGFVPVGFVHRQTVWVHNQGQGELVIGNIGEHDPLERPFTITLDNCSGTKLAAGEHCLLEVTYSSDILQDYQVSFDIPSNDPITSSATVNVTARENLPWQLFVPAIFHAQ